MYANLWYSRSRATRFLLQCSVLACQLWSMQSGGEGCVWDDLCFVCVFVCVFVMFISSI